MHSPAGSSSGEIEMSHCIGKSMNSSLSLVTLVVNKYMVIQSEELKIKGPQ